MLFVLFLHSWAFAAPTTEIRQLAQQIAGSTPWASARAEVMISHPLEVQTLSIEKQETKASPATSMLRVYQFNYRLRKARMVVLDSDTRSVVRTRTIDSVHLPLNAAEIAYAYDLLSRENHILASLRDEQVRRGDLPFDALSELDVKASVYEPLDDNHPCHRQRCALISLFDDTSTVFSVEPVINLQSLQVMVLHDR